MQTTCECLFCRGLAAVSCLAVLAVAGEAQEIGPVAQRVGAVPPGAVAARTVATMAPIVVVGSLDEDREKILPDLGATVYTIDQEDIEDLAQGNNIPFDKLVLRFPGVSQDSEGSGSVHVRDDHGNVQYRINDVLIPEGITGFGDDFDPRFADRVDLITGALPAQYGFRTTAVIDIHTKSGAFEDGGELELYGGSHAEIRPSLEYGGSQGKLSYYFSGSYLQDDLGIENPTSSANAIHDHTDQYRGFAYLSYVIDPTSRVSLIAGEAYDQFQIPNTPGLPGGTDNLGTTFGSEERVTAFDSAELNESQREQNNYEVLAYQKRLGDFNFQVSLFNRYSQVNFSPDETGDLFFNGVAGKLGRSILSNGAQFDGSYELNPAHTIRGGLLLNAQASAQTATTTVFPTDPATGGLTGAPAFGTFDRSFDTAYSYGFYLQDEWKVTKALTLNSGGRFDLYKSSEIRENQLSPRINATYQLGAETTIHGGYASYFTPSPLENIPEGSVSQFVNTTNAATPGLPNDAVKCERDQYFDLGLTHDFTKEYQMGLDGYFKTARNLIDDGQFGAAPILSAFNYATGQLCGVELSQSYSRGAFLAYANFAAELGLGERVNSAQSVLFSADDYHYISNHYIYLDHSQTFTGSAGISYKIFETQPYLEMVCGSGLRSDIDSVPNGGSVPAYDTFNVGFTQTFGFMGWKNFAARFDCINVGDQVYELRDGSGVGVFAPQFGQRRSFYGGVTYLF